MKIGQVRFEANIRNQKHRASFPRGCTCEIEATVGDMGTVELHLWRDGDSESFAQVYMWNPSEMRKLARLLNATADAQDAQNDKTA